MNKKMTFKKGILSPNSVVKLIALIYFRATIEQKRWSY